MLFGKQLAKTSALITGIIARSPKHVSNLVGNIMNNPKEVKFFCSNIINEPVQSFMKAYEICLQ